MRVEMNWKIMESCVLPAENGTVKAVHNSISKNT